MDESLPLTLLHQAVLDFLQGRSDVIVFGAQAVNAYVNEARMTQDIDLISIHAQELAEELRQHLHDKFQIAVRIRNVANGRGFRIFQIRKSGNRHLIDIRAVDTLPDSERISNILVMSPPELIASKVISYYRRRGKPKSGSDWRDIAMLLLTFPTLKTDSGEVLARLQASDPTSEILSLWRDIVAKEIVAEDDEDEFM